MATGTVILDIGGCVLPDNSAGNEFAELVKVQSSASAPSPAFIHALFDDTSNEHLMFGFRMPVNYASAPVIKLQYKMASATSGNVKLECAIAAVSDGDAQDVDANAFATTNSSAATAVPGTVGHMDEISITLTNDDGLAAGDFIIVLINRDPEDTGNDTATGDLELIAASLEYTTT